eukprot:5687415-Pyramimonas_sp.AAC.1
MCLRWCGGPTTCQTVPLSQCSYHIHTRSSTSTDMCRYDSALRCRDTLYIDRQVGRCKLANIYVF